MIKSAIDPACTGQFSPIFLDYIDQKAGLRPFYQAYPSLENFRKAVEERTFHQQDRELLANTLQKQYANFEISTPVQTNLDKLRDSTTYTVTTGHQLNLFTGPLYFIYKIVSTINLADKLNQTYPSHHFVPVYWMASEDHDFMEINHFHFDGKKFVWTTGQTGAVGEFVLDSGLRELLKQAAFAPDFFKKAYLEQKTLADAVRYYVNHLFGEKGLVVIDANAQALKARFKAVIKDDLLHNHAQDLVSKASSELSKMGYKEQVFPREINFFFMEKGVRERIIRVGEEFRIPGIEKNYSVDEMLAMVEESPEKFSPNVVMRPLYQERILPNLAYLGGPAEVAYWLQLKSVFHHYQTPFPILLPRNFVMVLNPLMQRKMNALDLSDQDLFTEFDQWKKEFVTRHSMLDISLASERRQLTEIFDQVKAKAKKSDPTMEYSAEAAKFRALKIMDQFSVKIRKAEERKASSALNKMRDLKQTLFPGGQPQERLENFLQFFLEDPQFIEKLYEHLDPLDFNFIILRR